MEIIVYRKKQPHKVFYDIEDQQIVDQYAWNINNRGYCVGRKKGEWKDPQRAMHLILLGIPKGSPLRIDHKDCNPLKNTRDNLRLCTPSENSKNRRKVKSATLKYLGVSYHRSYTSKKEKIYGPKKIRATISVGGRQQSLGYFDTEEAAARAFDEAARIHHKEFGRYNFPRPGERSAI